MSVHINAETESRVPEYAVHDSMNIKGFFGDYRYLSNFYPVNSGVWWMGTLFPAVEHAYQAAKFDRKYHKEFVDISAGDSKKLAKMVVKEDPSIFNSSRWDEIRYRVMSDLVFQKFSWNPDLQHCLIMTADAYLEEANSWHDQYWGVCYCPRHEGGQNKLGQILMKVRTFWKQ